MNVHRIGLTGAVFSGPLALAEFADEVQAYALAVAIFAQDGDEYALSDCLSALGFDQDEIDWHRLKPGRRMATGFVNPADALAARPCGL